MVMDSVLWEMKALQAGNRKAIERNLRKVGKQSSSKVFDFSRIKGVSYDVRIAHPACLSRSIEPMAVENVAAWHETARNATRPVEISGTSASRGRGMA